jgi:chromosome segregation ATPase
MIGSKTDEKKVQSFIDDISSGKPKTDGENIQTKYSKPEMVGAVKILVNNNKELQNKLNEKGELNMDTKDMELLESKLDKLLETKFEKKFKGLETDLEDIKESSKKACTSGDCFADKLDELEKKFDTIEDVKTNVFDLKLDVNEKIKGVTESISKMSDGFTESISNIDNGITESITGMGEKLDSTCTGIECMNKRFAEEDDMVQCPACGHTFSLSTNTVNGAIVCPDCQAVSTLE